MTQFAVVVFDPQMEALKNEFAKELFEAGEQVSAMLFDAPWHSECRFCARQLAIDYIVKTYLAEAKIVLMREGLDAARQAVGWEDDVFSKHAHSVALNIRETLVRMGGWRTEVKTILKKA